MTDPTEPLRRARLAEINADPGDRAALAVRYGRVWDPQELAQEFDVLGFLAPFVVVRRKSDGRKGSLEFQHHPRFYFRFQLDEPTCPRGTLPGRAAGKGTPPPPLVSPATQPQPNQETNHE